MLISYAWMTNSAIMISTSNLHVWQNYMFDIFIFCCFHKGYLLIERILLQTMVLSSTPLVNNCLIFLREFNDENLYLIFPSAIHQMGMLVSWKMLELSWNEVDFLDVFVCHTLITISHTLPHFLFYLEWMRMIDKKWHSCRNAG